MLATCSNIGRAGVDPGRRSATPARVPPALFRSARWRLPARGSGSGNGAAGAVSTVCAGGSLSRGSGGSTTARSSTVSASSAGGGRLAGCTTAGSGAGGTLAAGTMVGCSIAGGAWRSIGARWRRFARVPPPRSAAGAAVGSSDCCRSGTGLGSAGMLANGLSARGAEISKMRCRPLGRVGKHTRRFERTDLALVGNVHGRREAEQRDAQQSGCDQRAEDEPEVRKHASHPLRAVSIGVQMSGAVPAQIPMDGQQLAAMHN